MRVIFAGTPEVAVPALQAIVDAGHEIVAVISRLDAPVGRKGTMTASPVSARALALGLPLIRANAIDDELTATLTSLNADVGIVVAYGAFLPQPTLDCLPRGWLNLHFSDLPKLRGAAPVQWSLILGEKNAHTCVFRLVAQMDAGDIASVRSYALEGTETANDVLASLAQSGAKQLVDVLEDIESGSVQYTAQSGKPTFAPKLSVADAQLLASMSADEAYNRYRGVTPEPGAWIDDNGVRIKIHKAARSSETITPGHVELKGSRVLWGTATQALELLEVQPAGKQRMLAADWARGRR